MDTESTESSAGSTAPRRYGEVFQLAYPVVLAMLANTIMGLTDTLFMGRVGTTAQGGVGLGGVVTWTLTAVFVGTLTVVNTFVAQHFGAGQRARGQGVAAPVELRRCGEAGWHGLLIAAGFGVLLLLGRPLVTPLVHLFGAEAGVTDVAVSYALIRLLASPLRCLEMTIVNFLRGIGDTRTPMKISMLAVAGNVPLNYWLVFGGFGVPPLGPVGAAYATVAAEVLGALLLAAVFLRGPMRRTYGTGWPQRFSSGQLLALLRVGLPTGVSWALEMVTWTLFTAFVARFGAAPLAAHNIVIQVLHLSFMPGVGVSVAAQTLVGQSLGARDPAGARARGFAALRLGMAFMAAMGLCFLVLGGQIGALFSRDPEVVRTARTLFMLAAAFQVFDAMGMISGGILRGAGDTRTPMLVSVGGAWFVFVPLIWIFGITLGGGVAGSWGAATAYILVVGIVLLLRALGGKWQKIELIAGTTDEGADAALPAQALEGSLAKGEYGLTGPLAAAAGAPGGGDEALALGQPQPAGRALRRPDAQLTSDRTLNVPEMMDDLGDRRG